MILTKMLVRSWSCCQKRMNSRMSWKITLKLTTINQYVLQVHPLTVERKLIMFATSSCYSL